MKRRHIATIALTTLVAICSGSFAEEIRHAPKKQTICPVMKGNKINPKLHVDVNGKRIYVCCAGCIGKIKTDPDNYIEKMEAEGVSLEKVPEKQMRDDRSGHRH